jgi:hypothetical protein
MSRRLTPLQKHCRLLARTAGRHALRELEYFAANVTDLRFWTRDAEWHHSNARPKGAAKAEVFMDSAARCADVHAAAAYTQARAAARWALKSTADQPID